MSEYIHGKDFMSAFKPCPDEHICTAPGMLEITFHTMDKMEGELTVWAISVSMPDDGGIQFLDPNEKVVQCKFLELLGLKSISQDKLYEMGFKGELDTFDFQKENAPYC